MGIIESVLEVVAPSRCAGCDLPGALVCNECAHAIPRIERHSACEWCGAPFGRLVCTECWRYRPSFSRAICVGSFEPPLVRCLAVYKDAGERRLGGILGEMLASELVVWRGWADAVVPVPATARSIRARGFDHTGEVAAPVARTLEAPLVRALVVRETLDQRGLGRVERSRNVAAAFRSVLGRSAPRNVVVIDDVVTTGATVEAAAWTLIEAGVGEVRVGAVARAW